MYLMLCKAIMNDPRKQTNSILNGWPDTRSQCNRSIIEFWNYMDELSCIERSTHTYPRTGPTGIGAIGSHGYGNTIIRTKHALFWSGISKRIRTSYSNAASPIKKNHWSHVMYHSDHGNMPLLTYAYLTEKTDYGRLICVIILKSTWQKNSCSKTHMSLFSTWHSRQTYVRQFRSMQIRTNKKLSREWNFTQILSSPLHPQSNGLAENATKTAKRFLKKAREGGQEPYLYILEYRDTYSESEYTTAQLLMGRRTRSVILTKIWFLRRLTQNKFKLANMEKKRNTTNISICIQNHYQNFTVSEDNMQHDKSWLPAKVI